MESVCNTPCEKKRRIGEANKMANNIFLQPKERMKWGMIGGNAGGDVQSTRKILSVKESNKFSGKKKIVYVPTFEGKGTKWHVNDIELLFYTSFKKGKGEKKWITRGKRGEFKKRFCFTTWGIKRKMRK